MKQLKYIFACIFACTYKAPCCFDGIFNYPADAKPMSETTGSFEVGFARLAGQGLSLKFASAKDCVTHLLNSPNEVYHKAFPDVEIQSGEKVIYLIGTTIFSQLSHADLLSPGAKVTALRQPRFRPENLRLVFYKPAGKDRIAEEIEAVSDFYDSREAFYRSGLNTDMCVGVKIRDVSNGQECILKYPGHPAVYVKSSAHRIMEWLSRKENHKDVEGILKLHSFSVESLAHAFKVVFKQAKVMNSAVPISRYIREIEGCLRRDLTEIEAEERLEQFNQLLKGIIKTEPDFAWIEKSEVSMERCETVFLNAFDNLRELII